MVAKIFHLLFCDTCHKHLKVNVSYTVFEGFKYCDPCMEKYLYMTQEEQ